MAGQSDFFKTKMGFRYIFNVTACLNKARRWRRPDSRLWKHQRRGLHSAQRPHRAQPRETPKKEEMGGQLRASARPRSLGPGCQKQAGSRLWCWDVGKAGGSCQGRRVFWSGSPASPLLGLTPANAGPGRRQPRPACLLKWRFTSPPPQITGTI